MKLQIESLFPSFDAMQSMHGSKNLHAIYGAGCTKGPDLVMVFMNPTAKNIASSKGWVGIHAPWLGTKNVWKVLFGIGRLSESTFSKIQKFEPYEWAKNFCEQVYTELARNKVYITNLSKTTQLDARHLSDGHYAKYLELLKKEIEVIKPKKIVAFGNQVSSVLLGRQVKVSDFEGGFGLLILPSGKEIKVYPVYYPVGQGTRNMRKSIDSILEILKK